jgi:hypothetical protein
MTRADRDLVAALRAELAAIDPSRPCDRAAESAGLGPEPAGREAAITRLTLRLGRRGGERPPGDETVPFAWSSAAEHCRMAYLRGRFLARGSLSIAGARTHLEFVLEPDEAPQLAEWLADAEMAASWRVRRGKGVVTWKSTETVGTFLRRIGAGAALLELEARQVSRALRGELNRVLNAESANLHRAVNAAGRQLDAIARLDGDGRLGAQPYLVRLVADARRETPEATLAEIADRLSVHRSAVQRALERLERLVLHDDDGAGLRAGRRRGRGSRHGSGRAAHGAPAPLA